jgi:hypothetical protein
MSRVKFAIEMVQPILGNMRVETLDSYDLLSNSELFLLCFNRFHGFNPLFSVHGMSLQSPLLVRV